MSLQTKLIEMRLGRETDRDDTQVIPGYAVVKLIRQAQLKRQSVKDSLRGIEP